VAKNIRKTLNSDDRPSDIDFDFDDKYSTLSEKVDD